jgi:hypothetical protein
MADPIDISGMPDPSTIGLAPPDPTAGMPDPAALYQQHHGYAPASPEDVADFMRNPDATPDVRKAKSARYGASELTGLPRAAAGYALAVPAGVASIAGQASGALGAALDPTNAENYLAQGRDRGRAWSAKVNNLANYIPATAPGAEVANALMAAPGEVVKGTAGAAAQAALPDNTYQAVSDVAQDIGTDLPALGAPGAVRAGARIAGKAAGAAKGAFSAEVPSGTTYDQAGNVQAPITALKPDVAAPVTGDSLRAQPNPIPAEGTLHNQAHPASLSPGAAAAEPTPALPAPIFESPDAPPAEAPTAPVAPPAAEPSPSAATTPTAQEPPAQPAGATSASGSQRGSTQLFSRPTDTGPQATPEPAQQSIREQHLNDIDRLSGGMLPSRRASAISGDYNATGDDYQLKEVGSEPMRQQLASENDAMHAAAANVHNSIDSQFGDSVDQQTVSDRGRVTRGAIQKIQDWFQKATDQSYDTARANSGDQPMPNFLGRVDSFLKDDANYMPEGFRKSAQARLNQLKTAGDNGIASGSTPAAPSSVAAAEKFREWLNQSRTLDNMHTVRQLVDHTDTDVAEHGGPGLFATARNARRQQFQMLEEPVGVKKLLTPSDSQGINHAIPEHKVMDYIADLPREQHEHVLRVLRAGAHLGGGELAEDSAVAIREIQAHMVSRMHDAATNADGTWNARKFYNQASSYAPKLGDTFKDQPKTIRNLQTINRAGNTLSMDKHYPGAAAQAERTGLGTRALQGVGGVASSLAHEIPLAGRLIGRGIEGAVEGMSEKAREAARDKVAMSRLVDRTGKQRGSVQVMRGTPADNMKAEFDRKNPAEAPAGYLGKRVGASTAELYKDPGDPNTVHLEKLTADQPGSGAGTAALKQITDLADRHGARVTLDAVPQGQNKVSTARLKAYYERHGFESDGRTENSMTREPQGPASTLNIGLHQGAEGQPGFRKMSKQEAQGAVESTGAKVTKSSVLTPDAHGVAEPTLVASTNRPLSEPEMQSVLQKTKQSAIPQRTDAGVESMHIAPGHEEIAKREGWDQFNPDYFHDHEGAPLSQKLNNQRGSVQIFNDNKLSRDNESRLRGAGFGERNPRTEYNANRQMAGGRGRTAEQEDILSRLSGQRGSVRVMNPRVDIARDVDNEGHYAEARDANGNVIGHLHVPDSGITDKNWKAGDLYVNEEARRQGVASAMTDAMSKRLGVPFSGKPTSVASPEGAAFNAGYKGQRGAVRVMNEKPLAGAPEGDQPNGKARASAAAYAKSAGIPYKPLDEYRYLDPKAAKAVGDAYEEMKHDPTNPKVAKSYDAFKAETLAQYKQMVKSGVKVDLDPSYPYKNPREMHEDVRQNNHMSIYPTEEGFGTAGAPPSDHPLLEKAPVKIGGKDATYNDLFRAVHDYYGHAAEGNGFRANGEYNAWRAHRQMYSPEARGAMDAETLGQNSWVNSGPPGALNKGASSADTIYADQKAGLLPPKVVKDAEAGVGVDEHHITNQLTDDERNQLRADTTKRLVEAFHGAPATKEYAAAALAGAAKRGWYRNSSQAIVNQFGPEAPRFAALLSAMSPQVSVQTNFANALKTYINWDNAGRPEDPASIRKIMEDSSQRSAKNTGSNVLDAWVNNGVRALTADDPTNVKLSGPKVHSFYNNLTDNVHEVTNDAWMSAFAKIDPKKLAGKLNNTGPGKSATYLALSGKVRDAARMISHLTGETWTPAEVQETVWSWAKTAYEHAEEKGDRSIPDLVKNGDITDELIRSTPDFHQLFSTEQHRGLLQSSRFAGNAERMAQRPEQGANATGTSQARAAAQAALRPHLISAAERLEQLRQERRAAGSGAPKEETET